MDIFMIDDKTIIDLLFFQEAINLMFHQDEFKPLHHKQ